MSIKAQLDAMVYFGHGSPRGLISADIYNGSIPAFAHQVRRNCAPGAKILYACDCARRNAPGGSFAARLAHELSDIRAEVYGHDDRGHITTNPNLYRYLWCQAGCGGLAAGSTSGVQEGPEAECPDN